MVVCAKEKKKRVKGNHATGVGEWLLT